MKGLRIAHSPRLGYVKHLHPELDVRVAEAMRTLVRLGGWAVCARLAAHAALPIPQREVRMIRGWQFALLVGLAGSLMALLVVNAFLFTANRELQTAIAGRSQFVQQSLQLQGLYQQMVRSLAELSVRHGDADLKAVLTDHGISVAIPEKVPAASAPSQSAPAGTPATVAPPSKK